MNIIDMAKQWPCPAIIGTDDVMGACGAQPGQECSPRSPEDANWVHTDRRELMMANAQPFQASPERKRFFGFLR